MTEYASPEEAKAAVAEVQVEMTGVAPEVADPTEPTEPTDSTDVVTLVVPPKLDYDAPVDNIPQELHGFGSGKLGLKEIKAGPFVFNPVVSIVGAALLWGFAIWTIDDPEALVELKEWKAWVTQLFTWYYIVTQNVWIIFMLVVMYYFGKKKLGKDNEKPEFDDATYFAMLFSAGIAIGLVVYGTAEPLYHYDYWLQHRFNADPSVIDNDKANFAILTTIFHWGLHGWIAYALVGCQLGIMSFRHGLPLLMRTAFYPLLGKHTWGWIGDFIDAFTILTIVSGVCTSLGLGVWQITVGFQGLGWMPDDCDAECKRDTYLIIIWVITAFATLSVISGLGNGIKALSQISILSAVFMWLAAVLLGDTWFYLNTIVQSVGYYLQYGMTQLGWHNDAFAQQAWGAGGTPDQLGAAKAVEGTSFMDGWTIFYLGWWIAWSPFVGIFIARISRGRTVNEVVTYSLGGPLLISILWFGAFGGAAIGMENNAQLLWQAGSDLYNDPTTFQSGMHGLPVPDFTGSYSGGAIDSRFNTGGFGTSNGRCGAWDFNSTIASRCSYNDALGSFTLADGAACTPLCSKDRYAVNPENCIPAGATAGASKACGACFVQQPTFDRDGKTGCEIFEANPTNAGKPCPKYIKYWKGNMDLSPVCLFTDWDQEASWFMVLGQYGPKLAPFLQVVSVISLILFFITSSDSGSLVVDTLAANGRDEASTIQRVFWAFTEGGLATGLVVGAELGDEKKVLQALQAASICTGLPFTLMLCFMMPAIWYGFDLDKLHNRKNWFKTQIYGGFFDSVETVLSLGKCPFPVKETTSFFTNLVLPFLAVWQVTNKLNNSKICGSEAVYNVGVTFVAFSCFVAWIVMMAISDDGFWGIGWILYLTFAFTVGSTRRRVRLAKGYCGNIVEDMACGVFMYPNALVQALEILEEHVKEG